MFSLANDFLVFSLISGIGIWLFVLVVVLLLIFGSEEVQGYFQGGLFNIFLDTACCCNFFLSLYCASFEI